MAAAVRDATIRVPVEMIAAGASSTPNVFTYSENQELGARMATQHLIDLGHTDIAHFAGPWTGLTDGCGSAAGRPHSETAASRRGCAWRAIGARGGPTRRPPADQGEKGPAGDLCSQRPHRLGLIRALAEPGIRVPDDVSIVGFDDVEGSDFFLPPLDHGAAGLCRVGPRQHRGASGRD